MTIFDELKSKLEDTGLSENEAGIYIALLKIGESTTGKILEEYKMSAGKIYIVLDKLIKKGLVSYIIKSNIKHFKAHNPKNIMEYMGKEKQKIETRRKEIKNLLPKIMQIVASPTDDITVEVYEGNEGIKSAVFRFFDEHEKGATEYQFDNLDYGLEKEIPSYLKYLMIDYGKKMTHKQINLKMLISSSHPFKIREMKNIIKGTESEVRYMKDQKFASILFAEGRVLMLDYQKPSVVYIKSRALSESFIKMFESMWHLGKKI